VPSAKEADPVDRQTFFVKRPLAIIFLSALVALSVVLIALSAKASAASWRGDELRGRRMANGRPVNPDKLAAASWFYPLGGSVPVNTGREQVTVIITGRGPSKDLIRQGRLIDLSRAAFLKAIDPTKPRNIIKVAIKQSEQATFRHTIIRKA
jgi:rare lipoprotein A (peptidoglycan hydrolase)